MIPFVTDLAAMFVDQPVVAMDGALASTLSLIGDHVDAAGIRCAGLIVLPAAEVDFAQNLHDSVHLEDASSIDELISGTPEMVVIGPSALLGTKMREAVVRRMLDALPGVRVICATGVRTDLEHW